MDDKLKKDVERVLDEIDKILIKAVSGMSNEELKEFYTDTLYKSLGGETGLAPFEEEWAENFRRGIIELYVPSENRNKEYGFQMFAKLYEMTHKEDALNEALKREEKIQLSDDVRRYLEALDGIRRKLKLIVSCMEKDEKISFFNEFYLSALKNFTFGETFIDELRLDNPDNSKLERIINSGIDIATQEKLREMSEFVEKLKSAGKGK